jgi:hypothetical protein
VGIALSLTGTVVTIWSSFLPITSGDYYKPFTQVTVIQIIADLFYYFTGAMIALACVILIIAMVWKPIVFSGGIVAIGARMMIGRVGSILGLAEGNYPIKSGLWLSLVASVFLVVGGIVLTVRASGWDDHEVATLGRSS